MELTRREALAALAGMGVIEGATSVLFAGSAGAPLDDAEIKRLLAVTDVVYPSAVTVDESFVETYVTGRYYGDSGRRRRVREGLAHLEAVANDRYASQFVDLSPDEREAVLKRIGVDRVASRRDGRLPERIRYHIVNDLLFALYTTPVGGRLVGKENPKGYPGGLEAYQRGPDQEPGGGDGA